MIDTGQYEGMIAETVSVRHADGSWIPAYSARPLGSGPFAAVVLFHHRPGWDEYYREATRKLAQHGFFAVCPDLYHRFGTGDPDDVSAMVRAAGDVADNDVIGDGKACVAWLNAHPLTNGKVAVMGSCSGGRHALLTACNDDTVAAVVDLWGGRVVMAAEELNDRYPVAPIDLTDKLSCPVLGLFGDQDTAPTATEVDQHEAALVAAGKTYEFHRYPNAGHGFFYYDRPAMYHAESAVDGWKKVLAFLTNTLH